MNKMLRIERNRTRKNEQRRRKRERAKELLMLGYSAKTVAGRLGIDDCTVYAMKEKMIRS